MNSPYMGKFAVTQGYSAGHTGLDLVGLDSKEIHSTVDGVVDHAGWENSNNHKQGFGLYVVVKDNRTGHYYYYGHMSELKVQKGDSVKITDVIGIEGNTGNVRGKNGGYHCHYEIRVKRGVNYKGTVNVASVSGIPNLLGTYDDGYRPGQNNTQPKPQVPTQTQSNMKTIGGCSLLNLRTSASYGDKTRNDNIYKAVSSGTQVEFIGTKNGWAEIRFDGKILYCGKNYLK